MQQRILDARAFRAGRGQHLPSIHKASDYNLPGYSVSLWSPKPKAAFRQFHGNNWREPSTFCDQEPVKATETGAISTVVARLPKNHSVSAESVVASVVPTRITAAS